MFAIIFSLILGASIQDTTPSAEVVLVVERAAGGGYVYRCNGQVLDSKRVVSGVERALRRPDPATTRMFVLFEDEISLDKVFEVASLFEGMVGLTNVRYFAFSKKTRTMLEMDLMWDRWNLSFDGKLEKKPR